MVMAKAKNEQQPCSATARPVSSSSGTSRSRTSRTPDVASGNASRATTYPMRRSQSLTRPGISSTGSEHAMAESARSPSTTGVDSDTGAPGPPRQAHPSSQAPSTGWARRLAPASWSCAVNRISSVLRRRASAILSVTSSCRRRCTGPQSCAAHSSASSAISSRLQPSSLARATNRSRSSDVSS